MMHKTLSLQDIREFLKVHQARQRFDSHIPSMSKFASRAGVSRQTIYALLRNERAEFGEIAQIRISRAISQLLSEPSYQHSKVARIDLSGSSPRIKFGV